ncbi:MAG: HAD family hydrolase [Hominenteromicrobium sp.]
MAKVKAVIFDMDGTVADTLASIAGFGNAALRAHGYPELETQRYRRLVGNGADVLMRRMLQATGRPYTEADAQALRKTYDALYESDPTRLVEPYPGIPELLRTVRNAGIKTAVLSNKPDNMTCFIADPLFTGLFDRVHGQRAGIPKKPDPTALRRLCEELGVQPAECLYVGDSGVDMQTGANAGIVTAGVTWGFRDADELKENGAVHLADDAETLLQLIL